MVRTIRYRMGQFFRALTARVPQEEAEQALRLLPPQARMLFHRQAAQDQHHALDVYRALCRAGHTDPHLLAAALLHDAGKAAARLYAWQRAIIVLLRRFAPRLLARLSEGQLGLNMPEPSSGGGGSTELKVSHAAGSRAWEPALLPKSGRLKLWNRSFIVHAQHPEIGARWAQEAGCSPLTVALIRRHQNEPSSLRTEEDKLLAVLQAADSQN